MPVDQETSLRIIREELKPCYILAKKYGWDISEINKDELTFQVKMVSRVDQQIYLIEIKFDNYKSWPPYIEFIEYDTGKRGTHRAYPKNQGNQASFFHEHHPCICHPCSRKAYKDYGTGLHSDWKIDAWQSYEAWGKLHTLEAILLAIWGRISDEEIYTGRMRN